MLNRTYSATSEQAWRGIDGRTPEQRSADEVAAIKELVRRTVARTLYALLRSDEANVVEMSEDGFVAFCERVMSEGK